MPTIAPAPVKTMDRRASDQLLLVTPEERRLYETMLQAAAARQAEAGRRDLALR